MGNCKNCKWWELTEDLRQCLGDSYEDMAIGFCHRLPPIIVEADTPEAFHTTTEDGDWCGEYQIKDL